MKKIFLIIATLTAWAHDAHARTLHYGDAAGEQSIELTDTPKTFPALHVKISDDETVFGALYDVNEVSAPANSLHIEHDNTEYWVGAWCDWWPHLVKGHADCGPTLKLTNKFLTLDEVNQYIIPTDISQWELISACNTQRCRTSTAFSDPDCECAGGTLQPGIYLFYNRYISNGGYNGTYTRIAILDHAMGYKSVHGHNIYGTALDTLHEEYEAPSISFSGFNGTSINTNVSNLPEEHNIHVYRLK